MLLLDFNSLYPSIIQVCAYTLQMFHSTCVGREGATCHKVQKCDLLLLPDFNSP